MIWTFKTMSKAVKAALELQSLNFAVCLSAVQPTAARLTGAVHGIMEVTV